eukprot:CAMPEP_0194516206 /NCGR_PEP_ID=MMETSP0253-20130528/49047_1 /TAXON_ID=2966 /ORGANISM="Noctiluca scintillans" /LENGTH=271 /DNA_ID=CAMNT_0039360035 /DNA_START=12 /DNA_END=827 /DNA_ORIENTATION=-
MSAKVHGKCAALNMSIAFLLFLIAVSAPWWTRTEGDNVEQSVGLWRQDRNEDWVGSATESTNIDDTCDTSEEYNNMCKKISALRAFACLCIICVFFALVTTCVAMWVSTKGSCWRRSDGDTGQDRSEQPADQVVPHPKVERHVSHEDDNMSLSVHRAAAGFDALALLFSLLGLVIGATTEIPGAGWSLTGSGYICLGVSLVFSVPSMVASLMASEDLLVRKSPVKGPPREKRLDEFVDADGLEGGDVRGRNPTTDTVIYDGTTMNDGWPTR